MDDHTPLSERKMRILDFIIREYIDTAEPVGSRTISKNPELGVSAATIRNEMADLEELGLLVQPHTSAGRIPSEEAYRLYAINLPDKLTATEEEVGRVRQSLLDSLYEMDSLMDRSLELLSRLTNYTTIGISQKRVLARKIQQVSLVPLSDRAVVVLVVLDDGQVQSSKIALDQRVDRDTLKLIEGLVNEKLQGLTYDDIDEGLVRYIKGKISEYTRLLDQMFGLMDRGSDGAQAFDEVFNGVTNIFNFPEFSNMDRAKSFLHMIEQEGEIYRILKEPGIEKGSLNIIIGNDTMGDVLKDCSIITAKCELDGRIIARLGLIGPKRMDYKRAYSMMSLIQKQMNEFLKNW